MNGKASKTWRSKINFSRKSYVLQMKNLSWKCNEKSLKCTMNIDIQFCCCLWSSWTMPYLNYFCILPMLSPFMQFIWPFFSKLCMKGLIKRLDIPAFKISGEKIKFKKVFRCYQVAKRNNDNKWVKTTRNFLNEMTTTKEIRY